MTTRSLIDLLAQHPLFVDIDPEYIEQVAGCGVNVGFRVGESLFAEGGWADQFFLIRRGRVALETAVPGRGAIVVQTFSPDDIVGWSWLLPPYRWHFDGRAVEPTSAICFDGACLRAKFGVDPRLGYELMRRFAALIVESLQATEVRLLDLYGNART